MILNSKFIAKIILFTGEIYVISRQINSVIYSKNIYGTIRVSRLISVGRRHEPFFYIYNPPKKKKNEDILNFARKPKSSPVVLSRRFINLTFTESKESFCGVVGERHRTDRAVDDVRKRDRRGSKTFDSPSIKTAPNADVFGDA